MATATDTASFSGEQLVTLALDTNNGTHTITNGLKKAPAHVVVTADVDFLVSVVSASGPYMRVAAGTLFPILLKATGTTVINAKVSTGTGTMYVSVV